MEVVDRGAQAAPSSWLKFSPVYVAPAIAFNLFQAVVPEAGQEREPRSGGEGERPRQPLSVCMVSATLPGGFAREAGVRAQVREYLSPFAGAYGSSLLFVPRVHAETELAGVGHRRPSGRGWTLDVGLHERWAAGLVLDVVRGNGGRALVLAAKADSGRRYADVLRAAGLDHEVFSQWDGLDARQVVERWRADETSVLVGTRSMMTGVDAAGDTCSLVVIDRVPRNPGNVVDDARADLLQRAHGLDRWAADRAVYASDAALLLEQASGRLVRRVSDAGLVAVLDPRLMKGTPISYPEPTRARYMAGLRRFTCRTGELGVALQFLSGRRRAA